MFRTIAKRFLTNTVTVTSTLSEIVPTLKPQPLLGFVRKFGGAFAPLRPIELPLELFSVPQRLDLIHRVVNWFRSGERSGLASAKGRGEVAGSNRKIHAQKGTGRARAGDARAPHRRGGGACFGPKPRDFSFSLPLKIRWLAFRSALSVKYRMGQVSIIDEGSLIFETPKTVSLAKQLAGFSRPESSDRPRKLLILGTEQEDSPALKNFLLASRSIDGANVTYKQVQADFTQRHKVKEHLRHPVNAYHLISSHHVCMTPSAVEFYSSVHKSLLL